MAELTIPESRELGLAAISNLSKDSADDLIGRVFGLRNEEQVSAFLRDNPFLSRVILEARAEIRKYFPQSPLFLEVLGDCEGVDPDTLYLYISTDLSPARPG